MNCAGLQTLPMTASGTKASGQFTLALDRDNRPGSPATTAIRSSSPTPTAAASAGRSAITSTSIPTCRRRSRSSSPVRKKSRWPEDGQLRIRVHAFDPDFALRNVTLHAEREGQNGREARNWACRCSWTAPSRRRLRRTPSTSDVLSSGRPILKLKAGDVVRYWATAEDNKEPRPESLRDARCGRSASSPAGRAASKIRRTSRGADGQPQPNERKPSQGGEGNKTEQGKGDSPSKADGAKDGDPSAEKSKDGRAGEQVARSEARRQERPSSENPRRARRAV